MKLIIGLGNPGKEYENTRHNTGFMVLDRLSEKLNIEMTQNKFKGLYGKSKYKGEDVILLKPQTYMNLSGESVRQVMDFFKINQEDILVIYDDLDLQMGTIGIRKSGSAGGHNGMKSIIQCVGSSEFARLRIGIKKEKEVDTISYVLSKFSKKEMDSIVGIMLNMPNIIDNLLNNGVEYIMNHYNGVKNEIF